MGCSTTVLDEAVGPKYFLPHSLQKLNKHGRSTNSGNRMRMFRKPRDSSIDKCQGDLDDIFPEPETPEPSCRPANYSACRPHQSEERRLCPLVIDLRSRRSSMKSGTSNDTDGLFLVKNYNRYDSQRKKISLQNSHNELSVSKLQPKPKECRPIFGDSARFLKDHPNQSSMLMPQSQRSMIAYMQLNDQCVAHRTNISNEGDFGNVPNFNFDHPGSRINQASPKLSMISNQDDSKACARSPAGVATPPMTVDSRMFRPLDTNLDLEAIIGNCSVLNRKRIELGGC